MMFLSFICFPLLFKTIIKEKLVIIIILPLGGTIPKSRNTGNTGILKDNKPSPVDCLLFGVVFPR